MKKNIFAVSFLIFFSFLFSVNFAFAQSAPGYYIELQKKEVDKDVEKNGRGEASRLLMTETPVIELSEDKTEIVWVNNRGEECLLKDRCYFVVSKNENELEWLISSKREFEIFLGTSKKISSLNAFAGDGLYNVRICAEHNGTCYNYSRPVEVYLTKSNFPQLRNSKIFSFPNDPIFYSLILLSLMVALIFLVELIVLGNEKKFKVKESLAMLGVLLIIFLSFGGYFLYNNFNNLFSDELFAFFLGENMDENTDEANSALINGVKTETNKGAPRRNIPSEVQCTENGECIGAAECGKECIECYSGSLRGKMLNDNLENNLIFRKIIKCLNIGEEGSVKETFLMDANGDGEKEIGLNTNRGFYVLKYENYIYKPVKFATYFMKEELSRDSMGGYKGVDDFNGDGNDEIIVEPSFVFEYVDGKYYLISGEDVNNYHCEGKGYDCFFEHQFSMISPNKKALAWIPFYWSGIFRPIINVRSEADGRIKSYYAGEGDNVGDVLDYLRWVDDNHIVFVNWSYNTIFGCYYRIGKLDITTGEPVFSSDERSYDKKDRSECRRSIFEEVNNF